MKLLQFGLILCSAVIVTASRPVCQTTCGPVMGIVNDGVYSFRGIPYAEPPIGEKRWELPRALRRKAGTCWNGTYAADKFGNMCYQRNPLNHSIYDGSEDCLYLNIITPTLDPEAKKPVMAWIHGGGLQELSANAPLYAPTEQLAKDTDLVYVGFNYRLQAFGFMALQLLADVSPTKTSGNYGFMDMILALQWIKSNIVNFGGDPEKVTVFGQSSGGTAIFALLASPLCQGLFDKAWMLSASPLLNKTAEATYIDNEVFLKNANCTDLACLYSLTAEQVTSAVPWDLFPFWDMSDQGDLPIQGQFDGAIAVVDGYVLPESPFDAWKNGRMVDVPVVVGSCANEIDYNPRDKSLKDWTWDHYVEHVNATIGTFGNLMVETALKLYPKHHITPEFQLTSMASDARMNCPMEVMSMYAAATFKSPIYRYVVTSWPSKPVHIVGLPFPASYAFHCWDLVAFFGSVKDYIKAPTEADFQWQENVRREILAFVHTGHPYSYSWHPYPYTTANLSSQTKPLKAYNPIQCEFWLHNGFYSYAWLN